MLRMRAIRKELRPRFFRIAIAITVFVAAFVFCTVYFRNNIVPTVMGSAVAQVRSVIQDEDGKVTMVKTNSPQINMMSREIANLAQANLDALGVQEISIAVGTFTGLALLTGFGPDVIIKVVPIGSAYCDFVSRFESAGINQTLHKLYLDVYANVSIVTPIDEPTITVKAEVLVCENLIVGEVPNVYFDGNSVSDRINLAP